MYTIKRFVHLRDTEAMDNRRKQRRRVTSKIFLKIYESDTLQ